MSRSSLASWKILCFSLFVAVVAAASPILLKLRDVFKSVLGGLPALVAETKEQFDVNLWWMAMGSLVLCYVLHKLWKLFFAPLEMQRDLHETGYTSDGKRSLKDVANEVRKWRQCGDIPPVYPNGWFHVLASHELAVEQVKYVSIIGKQLAVFRGTDGVVHILNAYCPHLGANLGIGGKVVGNCLQCPFHGWKFRGEDGKCVQIPYSETVPDAAKVKSWPCVEMNCCIYLWYHAEGIDPTWIPDEVEEIKNGNWTYRGYTQHTINVHLQEIPENGADVAHLDPVHGMPFVAGSHSQYNFSNWYHVARHKWVAKWEPQENEEKHVGIVRVVHALTMFGYQVPLTEFHLTARQTGPGLVFMKFKSAFGDGTFLLSVTPKEPLLQTIRHQMYAAKSIPTIVAKFILYAECVQFERDVMIWNHKSFISRPLLVKEDHLIKKHRRWFLQFYSENSPRLTMRKETLEW